MKANGGEAHDKIAVNLHRFDVLAMANQLKRRSRPDAPIDFGELEELLAMGGRAIPHQIREVWGYLCANTPYASGETRLCLL